MTVVNVKLQDKVPGERVALLRISRIIATPR